MPLILPGNVGSATATTGYDVANSCRFEDSSDDGLNRTLGTPTNNYKWTISFWLKRTELGVEDAIMTSFTNTQNRGMLLFRTDDQLEILDLQSDSYVMQKKTNRKFRDVSAWYHIVISSDATLSSPATKFYVNGVEETSFATTNEYTQNQANKWNSAIANYIGNDSSTRDFSGYLAEFVFIDGQALAADQFGEFDSDTPTVWKPIDVSGLTFGTNGFYLDFEDSSNLGNDANGGTDWTVSNLTAIDQSIDSCTNNFATLNPLQHALGATVPALSEGNLRVANTLNDKAQTQYSNFAVSSGKWYCEIKMTSGSVFRAGISTLNSQQAEGQSGENQNFPGQWSEGWGYYYANGVIYNGGSSIATYSTFAAGDIISIAVDMDNEKLYFGKNGTWQNSANPATNSNGIDISGIASNSNVVFGLQVEASSGGGTYGDFNFGSPSFSISSSNTDGNGYGNFEYAVPSGYYSLNTKNLAEYG